MNRRDFVKLGTAMLAVPFLGLKIVDMELERREWATNCVLIAKLYRKGYIGTLDKNVPWICNLGFKSSNKEL